MYRSVFGCMNINAFNFDSLANTNDGSCIPVIYGCTDELANNFNPIANMTMDLVTAFNWLYKSFCI